MKKVTVQIPHEVNLIFTDAEPFRGVRLERVFKKAKKFLCVEEIMNIGAIEDHKGCLTVWIYKEDPMENIDHQFKTAWESENEYEIKVIVSSDNLPF